MHADLKRLIDLFLDAVKLAVLKLENGGLPRPTSNSAWSLAPIRQSGTLPCGATYYRHGYGVAVTTDTLTVDLDFGDRGETDGFDAWRLSNFAEDNNIEMPFDSEDDYRDALEQAVSVGAIVRRGSLFYLASSNDDRPA